MDVVLSAHVPCYSVWHCKLQFSHRAVVNSRTIKDWRVNSVKGATRMSGIWKVASSGGGGISFLVVVQVEGLPLIGNVTSIR